MKGKLVFKVGKMKVRYKDIVTGEIREVESIVPHSEEFMKEISKFYLPQYIQYHKVGTDELIWIIETDDETLVRTLKKYAKKFEVLSP